jgi:hypothetical protein
MSTEPLIVRSHCCVVRSARALHSNLDAAAQTNAGKGAGARD